MTGGVSANEVVVSPGEAAKGRPGRAKGDAMYWATVLGGKLTALLRLRYLGGFRILTDQPVLSSKTPRTVTDSQSFDNRVGNESKFLGVEPGNIFVPHPRRPHPPTLELPNWEHAGGSPARRVPLPL